jgi:hypothetical protein
VAGCLRWLRAYQDDQQAGSLHCARHRKYSRECFAGGEEKLSRQGCARAFEMLLVCYNDLHVLQIWLLSERPTKVTIMVYTP